MLQEKISRYIRTRTTYTMVSKVLLIIVLEVLGIFIIDSIVYCSLPTPVAATVPVSGNSPTPDKKPAPANGPPAAAIIPADKYPKPRRDESVEDIYPGSVKIKDPYRWMENSKLAETKTFVQEENTITKTFLEKSPFRTELQARYKELNDYPTSYGPFQHGKHFFTFRNTGSQNQNVLYVSDSIKDVGKVLFDPNTLSTDNSVTFEYYAVTDDGQTFAYETSEAKSEWYTVHFKNVENGTLYGDKLEKLPYTEIHFSKDFKGLFYTYLVEQKSRPKDPESKTEITRKPQLLYHLLGNEQNKDILVAEFADHLDYLIKFDVSCCGKFVIVTLSLDGVNTLVYVIDISQGIKVNLPAKAIVTKADAVYLYETNIGNQFIFLTNKNAENQKLISVDTSKPEDPKSWKDLVPEDKNNRLAGAKAAYDKYLVLSYIVNVNSVLQLHDVATGQMIKKFSLDFGTVGFDDIYCSTISPHLVFTKVSFISPGINYHCDLSTPPFDLEVIFECQVKNFDPKKFTTEQIFYASKDGTKVPMYIVHKKDLQKDGSNFAFLYKFDSGAFGPSAYPGFKAKHAAIISNFDGVYAIASIRGGAEYGKRWQQEGSLDKKQNSFDDYQAAAEYLIAEKYTNNKMLVINGEFDGGLLMGACLNQKPDLFGAVIAKHGLMDMLRYDKFDPGKSYVTEYGAPSDPKFFPILFKYSPLHNIKNPEGCRKQYPPTMLTSSYKDNPDLPFHSLKFIATLQYEAMKYNQTNPFIIKVELDDGHSSDKPQDETMAENAELLDMMSFIILNLGIKYHP